MTSTIDVLCVGMASYDLIFTVDRPLKEDDKSAVSLLTQSGGGPAAGLTADEIRQAQYNSLEIAFISDNEKQSLMNHYR